MNSTSNMPMRPRLAENAMLRRHLVDGEQQLFVHDVEREEMLAIDEQQLAIILCCDGTRDLGGIMLALSAQDRYRCASEVEKLLIELHGRELLADGIAPKLPALLGGDSAPTAEGVARMPAAQARRPVEVLAGYRFHCDGNGSCCVTYSSVPFSQREADRGLHYARVSADSADSAEGRRQTKFMPLFGSSSAMCAVTMNDGCCGFLQPAAPGEGTARLCQIHRMGGADAKPATCLMFPRTFVDDGSAIRVSVGCECPCVMSSALSEDMALGAPLVDPALTQRSELPAGAKVVSLPEQITLTSQLKATSAELRLWSDCIAAESGDLSDPCRALWALSKTVAEHGLDLRAARATLSKPLPEPDVDLALLALSAVTEEKHKSAQGWRSQKDRTRLLSQIICHAAQDLLVVRNRERLLQPPSGRELAQERFYVRALLFSYQLVDQHVNLTQALRDRAIRLLLARSCAARSHEFMDDPARAYPIAAVEAMMRGQGLARYAHRLP